MPSSPRPTSSSSSRPSSSRGPPHHQQAQGQASLLPSPWSRDKQLSLHASSLAAGPASASATATIPSSASASLSAATSPRGLPLPADYPPYHQQHAIIAPSYSGSVSASAVNTSNTTALSSAAVTVTEAASTLANAGASSIPRRPPSFEPFFTLIENAQAPAVVHPIVHYIFADDDSDLITEAALKINGAAVAAAAAASPMMASSASASAAAPGPSRAGSAAKSRSSTKRSPAADSATAAATDRYVLLNLAPSGRSVVSAQSMTSDWQVLDAEIGPAPMLEGGGGGGGGESPPDRGLMLKIKGTEAPVEAGDVAHATGVEGEALAMEELVERFRVRMEELRKVVEAGLLDEGGSEQGETMITTAEGEGEDVPTQEV